MWAYVAVTGIITVAFGAILAALLSWSQISAQSLVYACISGILTGLFIYTWLFVLEQEDTSNIVGFAFVYPLFVALLSFLFLHEKISMIGYSGMLLTVLGIVLLSARQSKINKKTKWQLIVLGVVILSAWGFFTKIAVTNIPPLHAYAVSACVEGIILLCALCIPSARKGFTKNLHMIGWATASEIFNWAGYASVFVALATLPATIVTSIGAIMPVTVLVFERIIDSLGGRIAKDHLLLPKLLPLSLISVGVALLAIAGYS